MANGPIQSFPRGLLAMLSLKNRGNNPSQLGETVVPTVDLRRMYLEDQIEEVRFDDLMIDNVVGSYTVGGPRENEIWWITNFNLKILVDSVPMTVGYTTSARPQILPNTLQVIGSITGPRVEFVEDGRVRSNYYLAAEVWQDQIVPPGGEVGYWVEKCQIGGTSTLRIQGAIRFARLLI